MTGPHAGQPVLTAGRPPAAAPAAVILVHGRGGSAEDILGLVPELGRPDLAYLAPQAADSSWYPYRFMAPLEQNEPWLSSGLATLGELLAGLAAAGIGAQRAVLVGFSQGACLALELAARAARRYGAVAGFSGGLIGPPGTPRDYSAGPAGLDGTPVLLGCSDRDPHIPLQRVHETAQVMAALGGRVSEQIYPAMGHVINADEIERLRRLLDELAPPGRSGLP
ncbi:MAG TPA: dienelactone hydrolase family protein [Thermoanaerobaculia bacterium]|nr:dienelactone hydrolase family protein [Thermoanaerobaculia bacterium]